MALSLAVVPPCFCPRGDLLIERGELGRGLLPDLGGFGLGLLPDLLVGHRPLLPGGFGGGGRGPVRLRAGLATRHDRHPVPGRRIGLGLQRVLDLASATARPPVIWPAWSITAASAPAVSASRPHAAVNADAADPCQPPGPSLVS